MKIPTEILAQIARDVDDFFGGEQWNISLSTLTDEEFRQWELLMIAQIIARGVATLDCVVKEPQPFIATAQTTTTRDKVRNLCRRLLKRA